MVEPISGICLKLFNLSVPLQFNSRHGIIVVNYIRRIVSSCPHRIAEMVEPVAHRSFKIKRTIEHNCWCAGKIYVHRITGQPVFSGCAIISSVVFCVDSKNSAVDSVNHAHHRCPPVAQCRIERRDFLFS